MLIAPYCLCFLLLADVFTFAYHSLLTALAYQCEDLEGTPYEQNTKYFLKKTVDNGLGDQDAADIIFVMDESGLICSRPSIIQTPLVTTNF